MLFFVTVLMNQSTKTGTGSGTVTSSPSSIDCGATCATSFPSGTVVTLTAATDANSVFTGWSGCSGTGPCTVTMNAALTVTATFDVTPSPAANELDGQNDFAHEATGTSSPSPLDVDTFTIEAWVFPTQNQPMAGISDGAYTLDVWFQSGAANNGLGVRFNLFRDGGSFNNFVVFRDIQLNEWNHVAAMVDSSTRECWLAINGNVGKVGGDKVVALDSRRTGAEVPYRGFDH